MWNEEHERVQNLLKDLEDVDTQLLSYMFNYNEKIRKGEEWRAREVTIEHKKAVLDPTRREAMWEHTLNIKKRLELAK